MADTNDCSIDDYYEPDSITADTFFIDEIKEVRKFKSATQFTTKDIAQIAEVPECVITALLRGKVDRLKKREDGFYINPLTYFDFYLYIGKPRPIRRDGRPIITGWRKTNSGAVPIKFDFSGIFSSK